MTFPRTGTVDLTVGAIYDEPIAGAADGKFLVDLSTFEAVLPVLTMVLLLILMVRRVTNPVLRQISTTDDYVSWFAAFLPDPPATLLEPAVVADRADAKTVHLDGLNLSRAWTLHAIASALPAQDARRAILQKAAGDHLGVVPGLVVEAHAVLDHALVVQARGEPQARAGSAGLHGRLCDLLGGLRHVDPVGRHHRDAHVFGHRIADVDERVSQHLRDAVLVAIRFDEVLDSSDEALEAVS